MVVLEKTCSELTSRLSRLEEKVLRGEIRDKRSNLIFHGLKEKHMIIKEECKQTISQFLRDELKIESEMEIGRCHRLGSVAKGNKPRGDHARSLLPSSSCRTVRVCGRRRLN